LPLLRPNPHFSCLQSFPLLNYTALEPSFRGIAGVMGAGDALLQQQLLLLLLLLLMLLLLLLLMLLLLPCVILVISVAGVVFVVGVSNCRR
jgi:hypothetical protein